MGSEWRKRALLHYVTHLIGLAKFPSLKIPLATVWILGDQLEAIEVVDGRDDKVSE